MKTFFITINLSLLLILYASIAKSQYVQPERNDTVKIFSQLPFDTAAAANALGRGNSTIKGVAFTRARNANTGSKIIGSRIYAYKSLVKLFPVTPYLLDFLELKKKKYNAKKLRFVYMSPQAYYYHYEAITNSTGEFTFPHLKPGKYYLETVVGQIVSGTYDKYAGHAEDGYGGINYYQTQSFSNRYDDLVTKFVEITNDGQVLEIKLK